MCGIVSYFGPHDGVERVLNALELLTYRAPDSSGLAVLAADGQRGAALARYTQLADLLDRRDAEVLSGLERPFVDSVLESMHSVVNCGKRLSKTN